MQADDGTVLDQYGYKNRRKIHFIMKLANGMMPGTNGLQDVSANGLANVQKRLTLLYPEKHELKISVEQEMFIVHLNIQLDDSATLTTDKDEKPVIDRT